MLAYEPPDRVVISWDISPRWQIETDPDRTSEVEVRFLLEGAERTRVELEHRNLDRHRDGWQGLREGVDSGLGLEQLRAVLRCEFLCSGAPRGDGGLVELGRRRRPARDGVSDRREERLLTRR